MEKGIRAIYIFWSYRYNVLKTIYDCTNYLQCDYNDWILGCPWNNKKLFRFEPQQTETQSVSVVFGLFRESKKHFFWFVSVFQTGIKTTKTNKIFSKQTKKISKKRSLLGDPRKRYFFFSVQTETNRNSICLSYFSVCFFAKPKHFFFGLFRFILMFRTSIETTKTNRTYGMGN